MQTSEREQFEEQWKSAFEGSEAAPSDKVWLSVESSLANAQNDINKRRVVYYQRLAAALLFLCLASILITYWQYDASSSKSIAENSIQKSSGKLQDSIVTKSNVNEPAVVEQQVDADRKTGYDSENNSIKKNPTSGKNKNYNPKQADILNDAPLTASVKRKTSSSIVNSTIANELNAAPDSLSNTPVSSSNVNSKTLAAANENEKSRPLTEQEEKEIVKKMLADAGVVTEDNTEEKKIILKNPAWIAVGASGGSYATQATAPGTAAMMDFATLSNMSSAAAFNQTSVVSKPASVGTAYSFGIMVGKPLSKRWLLQAGLTYLNRRSDYESNIVADGDQIFYPQITKSNISSSYSFTNPYAITSTTEFLSVPVQIGFVIIDKKIGWVINSGVSGDVFLSNTLVDKSGIYKLVSQSGDDTAYRSVSWSGLANTEVTLRLSEHYRFALVPGLRYSITNIVKDDSGYSKPLTLDIGFRFRYTF